MRLAAWYGQMMLGLVPQLLVLARFPQGDLALHRRRRDRCSRIGGAIFSSSPCWTSLGWFLWAPAQRIPITP